MSRLRYLILILLLASSSVVLNAQNDELMLGMNFSHNATFGSFASVSLETLQTFRNDFGVRGGVQYGTIGKMALEARPAYFKDLSWGRFSAEALLSYTYMTSVHNFAAGAGAGLSGKWVGGSIGYYYRVYGNKGDHIEEPFNLYYEFYVNLLPMIERWDMQLLVTNSSIFELERHFQPSFMAQCRYYPKEYLGISMCVSCKPAGMFHLSADYYQSYLKLGVCYRW